MSKLVAFLGFLAFLLSISKPKSTTVFDDGIVWPNVNWNSSADPDDVKAAVNWTSGGG